MALHNNELDYTKRDFRLAAYEGDVLQWFEFKMICMGTVLPARKVY